MYLFIAPKMLQNNKLVPKNYQFSQEMTPL